MKLKPAKIFGDFAPLTTRGVPPPLPTTATDTIPSTRILTKPPSSGLNSPFGDAFVTKIREAIKPSP